MYKSRELMKRLRRPSLSMNAAEFAKGEAADEIEQLCIALTFAANVIKSSKSWTPQCEDIIGTALKGGKE